MTSRLRSDIRATDPMSNPRHSDQHNYIALALEGLATSVVDYGAAGDGSTDDTAAIAAAVTASAGGGVVYFPPGTYMTDKITLVQGVSIQGAGRGVSVLKLNASENTALLTTDGFVTTDTNDGIYDFFIRDITFNGNKANQSGNSDSGCVQLYGYRYLFDAEVINGESVGLYTTWGSASPDDERSMESHFINPRIESNGTDGWYHNGPHDSVAVGGIAALNGARGYYVGSRAGATRYIGCHSWGASQTYPWEIDAANTKLTDCEGEGGSTQQLKISASDVVVIGGHYWAAGGAAKGIEINGSISGLLIDTKVTNCTTWAFLFTGAPTDSVIRGVVYGTSGAALSGTPADTMDITLTVSGGQTGTVRGRKTIGPWYQDNVAANQTNVVLTTLSTGRSVLPMMRAGFVTGIEVRTNDPRSAGSATVEVSKNGSGIGLTAVLNASNATHKATTQGIGADSYAIGDELGVIITTDSDWLPTTADITVIVEIAE